MDGLRGEREVPVPEPLLVRGGGSGRCVALRRTALAESMGRSGTARGGSAPELSQSRRPHRSHGSINIRCQLDRPREPLSPLPPFPPQPPTHMLVDSRIIHHLCIPSFPTLESLAVSLWLATGGVPDFDLVIAAGAPSLRHLSIIGLQDFAIDYKSLLRQLPLLGSLSLCRATKTLPLVGPWVPPCLTTLTAWCLSYVPPGIPNHPPVLHKYLSAVTLSLSLPGFANLKRLVVPEVPESTWQKSNDAKTLLATKTLVANCDDRGIAVFCRGRIWMAAGGPKEST